jgi:hydrogenase nickel incorporation protein HypA/HybF
MHELAVTESILEITLRHAKEAGATAVSDIHLVIGALSSIVDQSVQFYWDIISEGTIAASAQLHFRRIPGRMECRACGQTYDPTDSLVCPFCDSERVKIIAGEEFYLEAIDVARDEPEPTAAPD